MTISAKIIADSISNDGIRLTTFELEYPRFIHAEMLTHRLFSRNAASSRAIPVNRAIELIKENTAMPIHWGKNQPGMSAKEECNEPVVHPFIDAVEKSVGHLFRRDLREVAWNVARDLAITMAKAFDKAGYHKQIVNRLLEPFTHIKVVLTATEYDNWLWLRNHVDAQPEIHELAQQTLIALDASMPVELSHGSWHVPYYKDGYWIPTIQAPVHRIDIDGITLDDAIAVSASCCAQVSYRRLDDSLEKARDIYKRLVETTPVHASPFEHQASPMKTSNSFKAAYEHLQWEEGVTHTTRVGDYWSGNFRGWIQNRQLIKDNACWNYKEKV